MHVYTKLIYIVGGMFSAPVIAIRDRISDQSSNPTKKGKNPSVFLPVMG